jgi:hypothetical protein
MLTLAIELGDLSKCNASLSKYLPNSRWLYLSHLPRCFLYPALDSRSLWPAAPSHGIGHRPLLMFLFMLYPSFGWNQISSYWCYGHGVCLPNLPRYWVVTNSLVLPCGDLDHTHSLSRPSPWLFHQLDVCLHCGSNYTYRTRQHLLAVSRFQIYIFHRLQS